MSETSSPALVTTDMLGPLPPVNQGVRYTTRSRKEQQKSDGNDNSATMKGLHHREVSFTLNSSEADKRHTLRKQGSFDSPSYNGETSPELLATSVGKDSDGVLIPSSSSISLLSLNSSTNKSSFSPHGISEQWRNNLQRSMKNQHRYPIGTSSSYLSGIPTQPTNMGAPATLGTRRSSFAKSPVGIPMRKINSNTHSIQIKVGNGRQVRQKHMEPDSPSLGPVSASGSPSCFFLTDNSPPSSLQSNHSGINLYMGQFTNGQRLSRQGTRHGEQVYGRVPSKRPISRTDSISSSIGGKSPDFLPVSSTIPSMTPLNLSFPGSIHIRSGSISPQKSEEPQHDDIDEDEPDENEDDEDDGNVFCEGANN